MLKAYTDASASGTKAVGVAIVLSDDTLIDYSMERFYNISSSYEGELKAVVMAIRMVDANFDEPQDVTIYSDCLAVIKAANKCIKQKTARFTFRCQNDWQKFMRYAKKHRVVVKYTEAHKLERTPNMVCDYSSRIICKVD